jgi:hypothetical protein
MIRAPRLLVVAALLLIAGLVRLAAVRLGLAHRRAIKYAPNIPAVIDAARVHADRRITGEEGILAILRHGYGCMSA